MANGGLPAILVLVGVTWGCGGHIESTTAESPDASDHVLGADGASAEDADAAADVLETDGAGAENVLFRDILPGGPVPPVPGQDPPFAAACLVGGPLPVGANGLPNCIVVSARPVSSPEQLAACKQCDVPGLEPLVSPVPLETIGEGLSNHPCLCAVTSLPSAGCPDESIQSSVASWCYTTPGSTPSIPTCAPSASLGFSEGAVESGTLYVACFAP